MKKRYIIGLLILVIGVTLGFVNFIYHIRSVDVDIQNSKTKMGGSIVFAQMNDSVFAISLRSGHINVFDYEGEFLWSSRVSTGIKDDLTVEYTEDMVYVSYEHISNQYLVFNSDGYLGKVTSSPKTKYTAKNELCFNNVRFKSKSFGRIFIIKENKEIQLTLFSFWNWYWNDIGIIFIFPLVGIILLLPWMTDLLSKQPHNSRAFHKLQ